MFFFSSIILDVYLKIFIYLFLLCIISFIMLLISKKISILFLQDQEKISEYECGFEPFDSATRQPFDVHFYIVGLLFLIFDVEVALLLPWSVNLLFINWLVFWSAFVFIFILIVGLIYEWDLGVLDWPY